MKSFLGAKAVESWELSGKRRNASLKRRGGKEGDLFLCFLGGLLQCDGYNPML